MAYLYNLAGIFLSDTYMAIKCEGVAVGYGLVYLYAVIGGPSMFIYDHLSIPSLADIFLWKCL